MKKLMLVCLVLLMIFLSSCIKRSTYSTEFKNEYEALNGLENKYGKIHRVISIDDNNPYERVKPSIVLDKIKNKDTFYLYIGDPLCPWCRSVIEKSIEVAKKENIKKIYYIKIWDDEGNEIFRDKYEIRNNELIKTIDGTKEYVTLLNLFDTLLNDYKLTNDNGEEIDTREKRIYAPSFIYIKKGKAIKLIEGISDKQKDSREELNKEILEDEERIFTDFFKIKK